MRLLSRIFGRITGSDHIDKKAAFKRVKPSSSDMPQERVAVRLRNITGYAKLSGSRYSASEFEYGYHAMTLNGCCFSGRRDPKRRLQMLPMSLQGMSVLDIGSNQGGMLFGIDERIRWGVGLDFDPMMVNLCNFQRSVSQTTNLDFYVFDVDNEPLDLIRDFLPEDEVDVVFLLSVCMWVKRWRHLIDSCRDLSQNLFFETNGPPSLQIEQLNHIKSRYTNVHQLASTSEDDPAQKKRKLIFAECT